MQTTRIEHSMWDPFFKVRADIRTALPGVAESVVQQTLHFEVFIGPDRTDFKSREPSFPTLQQASRWAHEFGGADSWRVRSTSTGALMFANEARRTT